MPVSLIVGRWESTCILPQWLRCRGPAGDGLGPLDVVGPTAGKAGQRARRARTWPLSAATTLGTGYTLSSSEFPFSVFVSFLLTFFPSGIKGWMGTMVTGWCGQPGPAAGVAPGRGQQPPATRLRRSPQKGKTRRVSACAPGTAGERSWAVGTCSASAHTCFPSRSLGAACSSCLPGARRRVPPAAAAGCIGLLRASDQAAGDLGRAGAHPRLWLSPSRLRLLQPSCRHTGDEPSLGPLGPDPAMQEP